jgi:hypothetical protein
MGELLGALFVLVLVTAMVVVSASFAAARSVRRRNEVSRRHRTKAPVHWLAAPTPCAQLHRRLRDAVVVLRSAVPYEKPKRRDPNDLSPFTRLADEIELHAAGLDRDLQLCAHLRGPARSAMRRSLTGQVLELERLALRVSAAATAASPGRPGAEPTPAAIARIGEELDALEAARDEIARLEAGFDFEGWRAELDPVLPPRPAGQPLPPQPTSGRLPPPAP